MAKSAKLNALRSAAKVVDGQSTGVPVSLVKPVVKPTGVVHENKEATKVVSLTAQTHESRAVYYASMAVAPTMPDDLDEAKANEWFQGLTAQQRAAYLMEQEVDTDLEKADTLATMALRWMFKLVDVYTIPDPKDAAKTVCLIDEWPIVDTEVDVNGLDDNGKRINNPAIKKEPGQTKQGKSSKAVRVDFYDVFVRTLHEGKDLRANIESLQAGNPKSGNAANVLPKHKLLTDDQRQSKLKKYEQRWARFRSNIKDAIKIRQQWNAIKSLQEVELDYIYDDVPENTSITTDAAPFAVWAKGKPTAKYPQNVKNFLGLDVEWSRKNGGRLTELLQGEPKAPTTPTSTVPKLTWLSVMPTIAELAAYLGQEINKAALYKKATALTGTAEALADEEVLSIGDILIALDPTWKQIQDRYTGLKIKAADEQKDLAKRQAKAVGE